MGKSAAWLMAGALCVSCMERRRKKILSAQKKETDKFYDNYQLLSHWLEVKNRGGSSLEYFREKGYREIAVYGMGELACGTVSRMDRIYAPEDALEQVDAVVVTPFYAMDSIRDTLRKKISCPIVSLEEVVWSL